MRRLLIITASILLFIVFSVGVYFLFFANSARVVVTKPAATQPLFPTAPNSSSTPIVTGSNSASSTKRNNSPESGGGSVATPPRLVQIDAGPIVPSLLSLDLQSTTTASTTQVIVQYINQQNGNIYQYNSLTEQQTRTSNKTIPGIRSAAWLSDGSLAYVQYISHTGSGTGEVSTYAIPKTGTGGFFLPQGLSQVFTKGSNEFFAVSSGENGSIIKKASKDASNVGVAFQTPLSAIHVSVAGPKNYLVYTKPSATVGGYAFLESGSTEVLSPIVGPQKGLVALSNHAGTKVLVSYVDTSGGMALELVSIPTRTVIKLPIATIASKCVWSQNDSLIFCGVPQTPSKAFYPDSWYQGVTSFTDQIWEIDVTGKYAKFVLDFSKIEGEPLDAIALSVDPKGRVLSFVNKRTGALWAYKL